jgi:tetratricopeptide (TPR) repeat protein
MTDLDNNIHAQIKDLCAQGDQLAKRRRYPAALKLYWQAWDLLPEPKTDWDAATWILAAIGDANFLSGDFKAGRDNLSNVMRCPNALGNPFLHLRLGQCYFELHNMGMAADELTRALMGGGEEIFQKHNPKYWAFLKTRLKPPPGGWSDEQSESCSDRLVWQALGVGIICAVLAAKWLWYLPDSILRSLLIPLFSLISVVALAISFLNAVERYQVRKWNKMTCPSCGENYHIKEFSDPMVWQSHILEDAGAKGLRCKRKGGVVLTCSKCGLKTEHKEH